MVGLAIAVVPLKPVVPKKVIAPAEEMVNLGVPAVSISKALQVTHISLHAPAPLS